MSSRPTSQTGPIALLTDPIRNKGTAFTEEERRELGLDGLLPPVVETLEQQVARAYAAYHAYPTDLAKHIYLRSLQDTNEVLFYRLLTEHLTEMLPIVYTPTVGEACERFSHIYRRARGLMLPYTQRHRLRELVANRPRREVDVIVVTDGQRILGLGDQGVGGMGIPIGKLSLYTAIGGIHPARTLPIVLDVGTDNAERLGDPEYLGWRHERIDGQEYFDFVDQFVQAVKAELPDTLLQWEDFATAHARPILDRYRDELLTFNDDIQGTAAVASGAIIGAVAASGRQMRDQTVLMVGAGSAAIGVADMLRAQLVGAGLSEREARRRFYVVDQHGLLSADRSDLTEAQRVYARDPAELAGWSGVTGHPSLADVVGNVTATVLIGLSTVGGLFDEKLVRAMAGKVERPIILPLSNPTSHSEADPADLARWTDGRVLTATGSPYPPLEIDGRTVPVAQSNNVFVFPAVGLAVTAVGARRVTDAMMTAAANALGEQSPALRDPHGSLLPPIDRLRDVAARIAVAVAEQAVADGVAEPADHDEIVARVSATQWAPAYD